MIAIGKHLYPLQCSISEAFLELGYWCFNHENTEFTESMEL
jgi:hypothetical protein